MIPKVRTWIVKDKITGETMEIDTITKRLVKIIIATEFPKWWFRSLSIYPKKELTFYKKSSTLIP